MFPTPADLAPGSLAILSAMITPAVLILSSSSLLMATSQRLGRVLGRVRSLGERFEATLDDEQRKVEERQQLLLEQLDSAVRRAQLLQRSIVALCMALACFVLTSVVIGFDALWGLTLMAPIIGLGFLGIMLLLLGCVLLVMESREAMVAIDRETDYLRHLGDPYRPPPAAKRK